MGYAKRNFVAQVEKILPDKKLFDPTRIGVVLKPVVLYNVMVLPSSQIEIAPGVMLPAFRSDHVPSRSSFFCHLKHGKSEPGPCGRQTECSSAKCYYEY